MTLQELGSSSAVEDFVNNKGGVLTFSAHWCGPCNASKPALASLANEYASSGPAFGIVYESDLGDDIHNYNVRAFPTYILFMNGSEKDRVEGVNLDGIKAMIQKHGAQQSMPTTGGETLGGNNPDPQDAKALRLAKLGGGGGVAQETPSTAEPMEEEKEKEEKEESKPAAEDADVEMKDASEAAGDADAEMVDPTEKLDKEAIKTLTESMGFSLIRAQKGLLNGNGGTVEGAVEWLMQHQEDDDIDDPIPKQAASGGDGGVANSYKCNECGKILSNMANLELHANKTGHSDFEECTEVVKPMTAEEKQAKIAEIKELLKKKRAEREEAEKVDHTEREKQRRMMGKEMAKTREQMEQEQRKRDAEARRKEKIAFKKERQRIKAELERDKQERIANKGKLKGKLGVDGYNPDAIQYDVDVDGGEGEGEEAAPSKSPAKSAASAKKIDEYITKVSSYRAGGDGGKCLKVLKAYVSNVVDKPGEDKFKTINMENKAYKAKVKPFIGAKKLLLAIGFQETDEGTLHLKDDADAALLAQTKEKLEAALVAYG